MSEKIVRYEHFGGIVGLKDPPALLYVDRAYMRGLGYADSPLWHAGPEHLSAPTEVHFSITDACPLQCRHCTADAGKQGVAELSTAEIKRAVDLLAEMKVFHIAFGGGELFARPDAVEIAEYAASLGIVPNATSNGYYMTPELARKCRVFGQINISLDGVGARYEAARGTDNFDRADRAIRLLVDAGVKAGINCLVTRANFDHLDASIGLRARSGVERSPVPAPQTVRSRQTNYYDYRLTPAQNKRFYPLLMNMAAKYKPFFQVDCSFVPMLCYHKPPKKTMRLLGIEGCEGGNILLGVRPDGWVNACSHFPDYYENIFDLQRSMVGSRSFPGVQTTANGRPNVSSLRLFRHLPRRMSVVLTLRRRRFRSSRSGMSADRRA